MAVQKNKFGPLLSVRIEQDELDKFIANSEACKSTKDIVLRELVYAFNRYCEAEGGRFPVLQRLEIVAPGYTVNEGRVEDATPGLIIIGEQKSVVYPTQKKAVPVRGQRPGAA